MLIHESHIAEHGEISNTSPIASSRPIGLVLTAIHSLQIQNSLILSVYFTNLFDIFSLAENRIFLNGFQIQRQVLNIVNS